MATKRKQQADGRYRVSMSFSAAEVEKMEQAAGSQSIARWAKWAALKMAEKVLEVTP